MSYSVSEFSTHLSKGQDDRALELVEEIRSELLPLKQAIEKKTTAARRSKKVVELSKTYGDDLAMLVNVLNRSQTSSSSLLQFHADALLWLRFVTPILKSAAELEVEKHAASLCRKCYKVGEFQLGAEVASRSLFRLLENSSQECNKENRKQVGNLAGAKMKRTSEELMVACLAEQQENDNVLSAGTTVLETLFQLANYDQNSSKKYAESCRRSLLKLAAAFDNPDSALDAYLLRSLALQFMPIVESDGSFDLRQYADLANKAALSYQRGAKVCEGKILLESQLKALQILENHFAATTDEGIAAEEVSSWIDGIKTMLVKQKRVTEATGVVRSHVEKLRRVGREDIANVFEMQLNLLKVGKGDWTRIAEQVGSLPVDEKRAEYGLRVCRALEPYRRELCSKDCEVDAPVRHEVLTPYVVLFSAASENCADERTLAKLNKSSGALLEALKALFESRVELFEKQVMTEDHLFEEVVDLLERGVRYAVGSEPSEQWKRWTASIMYNNTLSLFNAGFNPSLVAAMARRVHRWSSGLDSMRYRNTLLIAKAEEKSGSPLNGVSTLLHSLRGSGTGSDDEKQRAVLAETACKLISVGMTSARKLKVFAANLEDLDIVGFLRVTRSSDDERRLLPARTVVLHEAERRQQAFSTEVGMIILLEQAKNAVLKLDSEDAQVRCQDIIRHVREAKEENKIAEDTARAALAEAYMYRGVVGGDLLSLTLSSQICRSFQKGGGDLVFAERLAEVGKLVLAAVKLSRDMMAIGSAADALFRLEADSRSSVETLLPPLAEATRLMGLSGKARDLFKKADSTAAGGEELLVDKRVERALSFLSNGSRESAEEEIELLSGFSLKQPITAARKELAVGFLQLQKDQTTAAEHNLINALKLILAVAKRNSALSANQFDAKDQVTVCGVGVVPAYGIKAHTWRDSLVLVEVLRVLCESLERLHNIRDAIYYLHTIAELAAMNGALAFAARTYSDAALILARACDSQGAEKSMDKAKNLLQQSFERGDCQTFPRMGQLTKSYVELRRAQMFFAEGNISAAGPLITTLKERMSGLGVHVRLGQEWRSESYGLTPRAASLLTNLNEKCVGDGLFSSSEELCDSLAVQVERGLMLVDSQCALSSGNFERLLGKEKIDQALSSEDPETLLLTADALRHSESGDALDRQLDKVWSRRTTRRMKAQRAGAGAAASILDVYRELVQRAEKLSSEGSQTQRRARLLRAEIGDNAAECLVGSVGACSGLRLRSHDAQRDSCGEDKIDGQEINTSLAERFASLRVTGEGLTGSQTSQVELLQELVPKDWNIVGFTLSDSKSHMFIYRVNGGSSNVLVQRLALGDLSFSDAKTEIESIVAEVRNSNITADGSGIMKEKDKKAWWQLRYDLDSRLDQFCSKLESNWLAEDMEMLINPTGGPTVLVLDHELQQFPWEMLPSLVKAKQEVSRVPSAQFLMSALLRHEQNRVVDGSRTYFVLNPGGDLARTQDRFEGMFRHEFGWTGASGEGEAGKLSRAEILARLESSEMFVYSGHGGAEGVLPSREVSKMRNPPAATLLFGCSSGRVEPRGVYEPSGTVLEYLITGSVSVVGTLWDVTDRDIDRFTEAMLREWVKKDTSLARALQSARGACKMKHAVGAAPIVYGLPSTRIRLETVHRRLF